MGRLRSDAASVCLHGAGRKNEIEKKMETEMETGLISGFIGYSTIELLNFDKKTERNLLTFPGSSAATLQRFKIPCVILILSVAEEERTLLANSASAMGLRLSWDVR